MTKIARRSEAHSLESLARQTGERPGVVLAVLDDMQRANISFGALHDAFHFLATERDPRPSKAVLSAGDDAFLAEHGGIKRPSEAEAALLQIANDSAILADMSALIAASLTGSQVAALLGIADATVRDRKRDGGLYAVGGPGNTNRFPRWQFLEPGGDAPGRAVPHLDKVLAALPEGLHPLEVTDFFTWPRGWLVVKGAELSPVTWLAGGGDPAPVVKDAATLGLLA